MTVTETWVEGRIKYEYQDPINKDGFCIGNHPNGKIAFKYPVKSGKFHGSCKTWHLNGAIEHEENYQLGIKHGAERAWSVLGNLTTMYWYLKGTKLPEKLAIRMSQGEVRAEDIMGEKNVFIRRLCIEEFGYGWFLAQFEHKIIDEEDENTLILSKWGLDDENICLLKVKCPSVGAFYTLRVPPDMKTVKGAVAWTFRVNERSYNPEIET